MGKEGGRDVIEVDGLGKTFRERGGRRIEALRDVGFVCQPGQVFGLLGPNGAGKTTALRIISTALRPSVGHARVMGFDALGQPEQVRRRIGFLSATTGVYGRLTPRELLVYFGRLFGLEAGGLRRRIDLLAGTFDLAEWLDRPCDRLTGGVRQRVSIVRAVLHDPPVMVLDEPTAGLDVLTSRQIVAFVRRCREEGKTVLFSTHIMSEVARLCDRLAVIHQGRLVEQGTVAEIRARYGEDLEEAFLAMIGKGAS
jgi:sodium transport system ATP-binding protein